MSNTNMSYLYPEFWAAGFDALDVGQYNLQNFVSRGVESKLANAGDTVNVPIAPDFGEAADWAPGSTITPSAVTQTQAQVILNKSKQIVKGFTDAELKRAASDLLRGYQLFEQRRNDLDNVTFAQQYLQHFLSRTSIASIPDLNALVQELVPSIPVALANERARQESSDRSFANITSGE